MSLRQVLRHLRCRCTESDGACVLRVASALWEKWLSLLEAARVWEQWSGDLKREWKFISEEVRPLSSTHKPCSSPRGQIAPLHRVCVLLVVCWIDIFCECLYKLGLANASEKFFSFFHNSGATLSSL